MSYENVLLESPEAGVWLLTINRPKVLNALNSRTLAEIGAAVHAVAGNPDARVLLVTGAGEKAFVAGADISEMQDFTPVQAKAFTARAQEAFRSIERLQVPAIALVNGYCLGGGCELAMACDFILASEKAVFGQPEVNLGILPGFGGTQRLPRLVGRGRALELCLTGRQVKAEEAVAWGLANHVYPAAELRDRGLEMARAIAGKAPVAVQLIKQAVQLGQDMDLVNACTTESDLFAVCCSTEDQKEGMKAFLEKRPARFVGR